MGTMLGLCFLVLSAAVLSASEETVVKVVPVGPEELGKDVTLPCQAGDGTIRAVEWTRSDLVAPEYVLYYSDGHSDPTHQNSSFKGRVQLVDGELETGDVSLILKNVSRDDVGTYECRVLTAGSRRKKRALIKTDPISTVRLQVTGDQNGDTKDGDNNRDFYNGDINKGDNNNGDNEEGHSTPLHVGLGAAVLLVCSAVVGLFLVSKCKRQRDKTPEPSPAEETGGDNLI